MWRERRAIGRYSIGIGGPLRRAAFRALAWAETRNQAKTNEDRDDEPPEPPL